LQISKIATSSPLKIGLNPIRVAVNQALREIFIGAFLFFAKKSMQISNYYQLCITEINNPHPEKPEIFMESAVFS
jgi:hypothetical protein